MGGAGPSEGRCFLWAGPSGGGASGGGAFGAGASEGRAVTGGACASPGTYLTHEAKGSDDAPDADTAIINAEGGQSGGDDKKEYFI